MAPELLDFPHEHDQRVDWWALGVLMFELMRLGMKGFKGLGFRNF